MKLKNYYILGYMIGLWLQKIKKMHNLNIFYLLVVIDRNENLPPLEFLKKNSNKLANSQYK